jgi:hypothetical protein
MKAWRILIAYALGSLGLLLAMDFGARVATGRVTDAGWFFVSGLILMLGSLAFAQDDGRSGR